MITLRLFNARYPTQTQVLELSGQESEYLIGSSPDSGILLPSSRLEAIQASIKHQDGQYYFVPHCESLYLNEDRVTESSSYPLDNDDIIRLQEFVLIVESVPNSTPLGTKPKKAPINSKTRMRSLQNHLKSRLQAKTQPIKPPPVTLNPVQTTSTLKCIGIIQETLDVKTFRFRANPDSLFSYQAGQFATLKLNINGKSIQRCYTISSSPSRPKILEITVKRVLDGLVSNWLHDNLQVGDTLEMQPPAGEFTCGDKPHQKLLLISAGSGITPMMSMARWLYDTGQDQDIIFFHGAKTEADIIFRQELTLIATNNRNFQLFFALSRGTWEGLTGRLDQTMLEKVAPDYRERAIYVCGPEPFMESTKNLLTSLNFPQENYFEESFGVSKKPQGEASFEVCVKFSLSGKEAQGNSQDSILELAEQAGVEIASGCRSGACGSCKIPKNQGEISYGVEPKGLNESEKREGYILACIAYPVTEVVIEA